MIDDPNQLTQVLHSAAPAVLVSMAILVAVLLLAALADGIGQPRERGRGAVRPPRSQRGQR